MTCNEKFGESCDGSKKCRGAYWLGRVQVAYFCCFFCLYPRVADSYQPAQSLQTHQIFPPLSGFKGVVTQVEHWSLVLAMDPDGLLT